MFVQMKIFRFHTYFFITFLILTSACRTHYSINHVDHASMEMIDSIMVDSSMLHIIEKYKAPLDSTMNVVVGYSEKTLEKGQPESLLGNFICDLVLEVVIEKFNDTLSLIGKSMVLLNNGGFRSSIPKGEITIGDVFRLMPFDNEIVILRLPGEQMKNVFSDIALNGGMPVAGVELVLRADNYLRASFSGVAFDETQDYFIITSDYIANGGGSISGLDKNTMYLGTGILLRDAIIEYLIALTQEGITVDPKKDGRIHYE